MKVAGQDDVMLPRGLGPERREPIGRVVALLVLILILVASVAVTTWGMATRPVTKAAPKPSTATELPTVRVAPIPPKVSPTTTERRTIDAAGPNTIPQNLTLPHENSGNWIGANLLTEACPQTNPEQESLRHATDVRTITNATDPLTRTETLAITTDAGAASAIYDEFAAAMTTCPAPSATGLPTPVPASATVANLADDGQHLKTEWTRSALFVLTFPGLDNDLPDRASYLLVAQAGRAVVIATMTGDDAPLPRNGAPAPAAAKELQAFADAMAPKLCPFKDGGCAPLPSDAAGKPVFPNGSVLLPDGNIMIPNGDIYDPSGRAVLNQQGGGTEPAPPVNTTAPPPNPADPTIGTG